MPSTASTPPGLQEPIRVALVITELNVGGAEKCLTQLALNLDRARFQPEVISLQPRPQNEQARFVDDLDAAGIPVTFLDAQSFLGVPRVVWRLRQHLRQTRPALVQTFLYHANVVGTLSAAWAGVPAIVTGLRVADPQPRRLRMERFVARWNTMQVAVSQRVAEFYRQQGFDAVRLAVIPNAVDVQRFHIAQAADLSREGVASSRRVLLFVGRLDERQKGMGSFLVSAGPLLDLVPDLDIVLAGDGPDRQLLEGYAQRLAASSPAYIGRVHFLGWRADVPQLLKRANVVVLPSRYEGMPNVVLEAMAAGRSVVASRAEGMEEIFGQRWQECTVPFAQAAEWQDRILLLLNDAAARSEIVAWGEQRIAEKFTIAAMVEAYQQLWTKLISEARASCPKSPSLPRDIPAPEADST